MATSPPDSTRFDLRAPPPVRVIIPACLFLSGFCALAYQVSWARYLSMFLGATAPAYTIVLATFMGGLALGAWMLGKMADESSRPLRLYARLELLVAALCFAFPLVMDMLGPLYLALASPLSEAPLARNVLRASLAVLVLAAPSILMGGTLPAATRFYVRSLSQVGSGVGRLYFVNAFGAVVGTLVSGFFLIQWLGLHGTFWVAAAINAAIGLWALRTSSRIDGASACPPSGWIEELESDIEPTSSVSPFPAWVATAALVATASSGAASMIYEVSWIRVLSIVLGGSTYAFTVMLAAVILGIAIGSALVASIARLARGGLGTFGLLEVAVAFIVLLMMPVYNRLSYVYLDLAGGIPQEPGYYPHFLFVGFWLSVSVMLVPTVLLGATFPLAARLAARSMPSLGGGVGRAYAFNTAGTLVGTIIAAHVLFPWLGIHGTFAFAASLNMAAGLLCLFGALRLFRSTSEGAPATSVEPPPKELTPVLARGRMRVSLLAAVAVSLVVMSAGFVSLVAWGPRIDQHVMARGMFRSLSSRFESYQQFRAWLASGSDILYYKDGAEGTVAILDYRGHITLQVNGKADASSEGDMPTQMGLGHIPMLLHPAPERALVIGLGSGATSAAILAHPGINLTTVELSPEVVQAAHFFGPFTRNVLEDERLDLVVDDAKAYLGLSRERFDVIVSEPSNPWVAGNADLFTLEFFRLMRSRLAEGGLVAQWFHDYEMTDDTIRTIARTFTTAFPYTRLLQCGAGRDYVLIGAEGPLDYDPTRIERAIAASPVVADDLETHLSIRSPLGLFTRNLLDDAGLRELAEEGRLHRSRRPVLDFQAPRGVFLRSMSDLLVQADQRWLDPGEADILITRLTGGDPLSDDESFGEVSSNLSSPFDRLRENVLRQWVEATGSALARRSLAQEMAGNDWHEHALVAYRELIEAGDFTEADDFERWRLEARVAFDEEDEKSALELAFENALVLARSLHDAGTWEKLGSLALHIDRPTVAAEAYERALLLTDESSRWVRLHRLVRLARANRRAGNIESAWKQIEEAKLIRADYWPLRVELENLALATD